MNTAVPLLVAPLNIATLPNVVIHFCRCYQSINAFTCPSHQRPPLYCGNNFLANRLALLERNYMYRYCMEL